MTASPAPTGGGAQAKGEGNTHTHGKQETRSRAGRRAQRARHPQRWERQGKTLHFSLRAARTRRLDAAADAMTPSTDNGNHADKAEAPRPPPRTARKGAGAPAPRVACGQGGAATRTPARTPHPARRRRKPESHCRAKSAAKTTRGPHPTRPRPSRPRTARQPTAKPEDRAQAGPQRRRRGGPRRRRAAGGRGQPATAKNAAGAPPEPAPPHERKEHGAGACARDGRTTPSPAQHRNQRARTAAQPARRRPSESRGVRGNSPERETKTPMTSIATWVMCYPRAAGSDRRPQGCRYGCRTYDATAGTLRLVTSAEFTTVILHGSYDPMSLATETFTIINSVNTRSPYSRLSG